MNDKKTLSVTIAGKMYTLLSDEKEDNLFRAARMVENELQGVVNSKNMAPQSKESVFVALKLATDLVKLRDEQKVLENRVAALVDLVHDR
jgi:cell division protein ZapA (FtsZ GTPase activity inhibitor)